MSIGNLASHIILSFIPFFPSNLLMHKFLSRYRISGSSLLAAMDQSSQVSYSDVLSVEPGDLHSTWMDEEEQSDGTHVNSNKEKLKKNVDSFNSQVNDGTLSRVDDRSGRVQPTVDVAEIIRRWTHALQRIHKQSLHLVCSFLYSSCLGQHKILYKLLTLFQYGGSSPAQ